MKQFLEKNKIFIEFIMLISALAFGIHQIANISNSIEKAAKIETYKFIEDLLNDSYPTVENFRNADKTDELVALSTATELESFLSQLNTCIKVGACNREVSHAFLCNSPKISGPLSFSSGIVMSSQEITKKFLSQKNLPKDLQDKLSKTFLPHFRVMKILNEVVGSSGEWKSYELIIEGCESMKYKE